MSSVVQTVKETLQGMWRDGASSLHALPRHIICHIGPTNSGKTHGAMEALQAAKRGIYCAPLRLLAQEMWHRMEVEGGKPCRLVTGELVRETAVAGGGDSLVVSCTTEMADYGPSYDVAVIDEAQLMTDFSRGWAFTEALQQLKARTLYVCGEPGIVPLVRAICAPSDRITVREFARLKPLQVTRPLAGSLRAVRPGDAVIAFSRSTIYDLRAAIDATKRRRRDSLSSYLVYGRLPVESRIEQARRFNEDGAAVLVASDAIGMGLNLYRVRRCSPLCVRRNIGRVVFTSMAKYDGRQRGRISEQLVKQIAGRAGRFASEFAEGQVTVLHDADMAYLEEAMLAPNPEYARAGRLPSAAEMEALLGGLGLDTMGLLSALNTLGCADDGEGLFFVCNVEPLMRVLELLPSAASIPIPMGDYWALLRAPVATDDAVFCSLFQLFVRHLYQDRPCPLPRLRMEAGVLAPLADRLAAAESVYRALDLYQWMRTRWPSVFSDADVEARREEHAALIDGLLRSTRQRRSGDA